MQSQHQWRVFYGTAAAVVAGAALSAILLPRFWMLIVAFAAMILVFAYLSIKAFGAGDHEERQAHQARQAERGRTILVELVDDQGNELDPASAERKLAQARLRAGPKDNVVGVRRRVPEE